MRPISSTDRAIRSGTIRTPAGARPYEPPRRLETREIPGIVASFRDAARRAQRAGFDGMALHGAHGYLLDQFLRDGVNDRSDEYGGTIPNRARLLLEAVDAAGDVLGYGRVAVRISPLVPFNDVGYSQPTALVEYLARELGRGAIPIWSSATRTTRRRPSSRWRASRTGTSTAPCS